MAALAAIEAVPTDSKDKPTEDVVLLKATVFSNPIDEMEEALERDLRAKIDAREVSGRRGIRIARSIDPRGLKGWLRATAVGSRGSCSSFFL